jgi:hypothetical protein
MEQFLRTYYTNLNPNATEEEILAFLESQGFGLGDQTVTGGIMNTPNMIQDSGGDSGGGINKIDLPVGAKAPSLGMTALGYFVHPLIGMAMTGQRLADQGKLPFGLNKILGSRASGDVEVGAPQAIQTGQSFVDEVALTGGDSGGTFDGASSMESYSQNPTGYSGSF